jgi:hypothetical protein
LHDSVTLGGFGVSFTGSGAGSAVAAATLSAGLPAAAGSAAGVASVAAGFSSAAGSLAGMAWQAIRLMTGSKSINRKTLVNPAFLL